MATHETASGEHCIGLGAGARASLPAASAAELARVIDQRDRLAVWVKAYRDECLEILEMARECGFAESEKIAAVSARITELDCLLTEKR